MGNMGLYLSSRYKNQLAAGHLTEPIKLGTVFLILCNFDNYLQALTPCTCVFTR